MGGLLGNGGTRKLNKYQEIVVFLRDAISNGTYGEGARLPSELELVQSLGASRPTVARAMRELQATGLIERKVGSGSYVTKKPPAPSRHQLLGLLIPRLGETEIFEGICGQIARDAAKSDFGLFWAEQAVSLDRQPDAARTCEPYIRQKVAGVFFAPLELSAGQDELNQRIVRLLTDAGIAIVLLDRDLVPFPNRSKFDLVGIDNYAAGYMLAQHLIERGCGRIAFLARPLSAGTVQLRMAGAFGALMASHCPPQGEWVHMINASDVDAVRQMVERHSPDAIICANDKTAAELMQSLAKLQIRVPDQIRVVGVDDVHYAKLLSPPLTTVHQPCREIGTVAMQVMQDRLANPTAPARHITLPISLVKRDSSVSR